MCDDPTAKFIRKVLPRGWQATGMTLYVFAQGLGSDLSSHPDAALLLAWLKGDSGMFFLRRTLSPFAKMAPCHAAAEAIPL
jgi:hypothetical protein